MERRISYQVLRRNIFEVTIQNFVDGALSKSHVTVTIYVLNSTSISGNGHPKCFDHFDEHLCEKDDHREVKSEATNNKFFFMTA